jgi:hypothetical protein
MLPLELMGAELVKMLVTPTITSQDFAYVLQALPGAYVFISNDDGDHRQMGHGGGPLHDAQNQL